MAALDNPRCFLDIDIGGTPEGRIAVELFADVVPRYACSAHSQLLAEACASQCSVNSWSCVAGQLRTSGACAQGRREWDSLVGSCVSKEAPSTASSLTSCARQVPLPDRQLQVAPGDRCSWHWSCCLCCFERPCMRGDVWPPEPVKPANFAIEANWCHCCCAGRRL